MTLATSVATLATVYRTIGIVLAVIAVGALIVYALVNILAHGKPEIGSEIELAPNRKPYLSDEELEGPKLDRALLWGLGTLFVIGVGLPVYWVMEPARQDNAAGDFNRKFVERGGQLFATTAEGGFNCAGCHGGMQATGGTAPYSILNPDGSFQAQVNWKAPALNTVLLRYSREEVEFILTFGRPFSPMPAWGVDGGGPLNEQQIQNLIDYLESIQITPEEAQQQAEDQLRKELGLGENEEIDYSDPAVGGVLFNLGLSDGFAGGAYACGRCHTQAWSFASTVEDLENPGGGALGPSLQGDAPELQFPRNRNPAEGESPFQAMIDFITEGSTEGARYGEHGQGSGKMPAFGLRPAEEGLFWILGGADRPSGPGMLTPEMIEAIVLYEREEL